MFRHSRKEDSRHSMKFATRAPEIRGNELEHNFGELAHSSTSSSTNKLKGFNHLKALQSLAERWVQRGHYSDTGRAYQALIEGKL
jgi:hypothetical protein